MLDDFEIKDVAFKMADAARQAILPYFRSNDLGTENKLSQGFDPVTQADRAAEIAMRAILLHLRPDDGIWGEEYGQVDGTSGYRWVLDPIDGTRAFLCGAPTWGVLIALEKIGEGPIFGLIDQPFTGERFVGTGQGAMLVLDGDEQSLKTRSTEILSDAILLSTFPEIGTPQEKMGFDSVATGCKLVRYGLDCYAYGLLAAGQIDLVIEAGLNAYDIQAPIAVIQAAGGIVTNWRGGPAYDGGQVIAAANIHLWKQALEKLAPYAQEEC